jgi:excisionase family DNA binding protein
MLSLNEAAAVLGCSPSGLRKLVQRRAIRFFQLAKHSRIKFRREWLDEFIDAHSVVPGAPEKSVRRQKARPYKFKFFDPSLLDL